MKPLTSKGFRNPFLSSALAAAAAWAVSFSAQANTVTTSWDYYTASGSDDTSWVAPASTSSVLAIDWGTGGSGTATSWGGINWVGSNANESFNASGSVKTWYSHPNVAWGTTYGDNTFYPSSSFPLLGSAVVGGDNHILELSGLNPGQTYKIQFVLADSRSMGAPDDDRSVTISGVNGTTGTSTNYRYGYADGQYAVITANVVADAGGYAVFKPSGFNDNGSIGQQINAMQVLAINNPSRSWTAGDGTWSSTDNNWTGGVAWTDPTADAVLDNASSATAITIDGTQTASTVLIGNGGNNGRYTLSGGTLNAAALIVQGNGSNDPGTGSTTINNVNLNTAGDIGVGRWDLVIGGSSNVTIGGQLRSTSNGNGTGDWGRVTMQDNANVTATGGVNSSGSVWGLTLNGGILTTPHIRAYEMNYAAGSRLTLNGTTIVATQDNGNFMAVDGTNRAFVGSNGAIFNTNGKNITVGVNLNDSSGQSGSLTKTGAGTLTLTGGSDYSGGTFVNGGTLSLPGGGGWGRITGRLTVNNGGTVETTGDGTGLGYNGQISRLTINNGGLVTSSGVNHIWHIGEGVRLAGGTLQSNSGVNDPNGAQLEWGNTAVYATGDNTSTIAGRIRIRPDANPILAFDVADGAQPTDLLVTAAITEAGNSNITKTGAGTMTLTGANNYSGLTTVSGGKLSLAGSSSLPASGAVTIGAGAIVSNDAPANTSFNIGTLTLNGGTLAATSSPSPELGNFHLKGNVSVGGSTMSTISADVRVIHNETRSFNVGDVDGGSGVDLLVSGKLGHYNGNSWGYAHKDGAGTMKLSGPVEIGGITINSGKLILEDSAAGWGAFSFGLTNNSQLEVSVTGGTRNLGASPSGSGSMVKSGAGTLNTNNVSSSGNVSITNGTLHLTGGHNNYWTPAHTTISGGGVLSNQTHSHILGLTFEGGTLASTGHDVTYGGWMLDNDVTVTAGTGTSTISASQVSIASGSNISRVFNVGSGSTLNVTGNFIDAPSNTNNGLTKAGEGTLILANANSYTGATTVNAGTLVLSGAGNSNNSDITMANNANLIFSANDSRSFSRSITGAAGNVTFNVAGNTSATGGGDPTNFAFQNSGSFTGNVVINSGLVAPSSDSAFGASTNVIKLNATSGQSAGLVATNSITLPSFRSIQLTTSGGTGTFRAYTAITFEVAGEISGAGNLEKTDGGTLVLSGVSTYTGATLVSAGTLLVNGELGNTAVTVGPNGTIGGSGAIAGSLNFGDGAKLTVNLADPLSITGAVTFANFGFDDLIGWDYTSAANGIYTLLAGDNVDLSSGVSNVGLANALDLGGGRSAYFQEGSLQVVVIPEPRAALLGGLGMLILLRRRRG